MNISSKKVKTFIVLRTRGFGSGLVPVKSRQPIQIKHVKLGRCNSSVIDSRSCATDVVDFYSF